MKDTSTVEETTDDKTINKFIVKPVAINDILQITHNELIDIVGIAISISPTEDIPSKKGPVLKLQKVHIFDKSLKSIEIALWEEFAGNEGQEIEVWTLIVSVKF